MEGRGRSRARKKHRIIVPKRLVAFMMTALMVFTTIGPDLSVAFAASEADVVFELDGADLVQSVEDAVAEGNEVTKEDVNFTDGDVDRYEELFFGEGKLYEAYPELNAGGSDADLRVFVRLPEDADESYIVTGDEELLFLFINNSDEAMTCRADITRVINGKERTKKTRTMLVKSYMNVFDYIFGDAEVPEEIEDAVENGTLATDSDASNNNEEVPTATDSDAAVTLSLKDVPRVTAPADAVATDSDASKDETDTEDQTPADDETNADANGPAADDADEEKETSGEKPAVSAGDLVGIDWCSTARVYTTTLNKLGLEIPELVVKEGSYELTINHLLVDDAGTWGKTETISLSEEDFEDGLLDTAAYEYTKDGMELAEKAPVVKAGAFEGEDGTYTLSVDMAYRVMDGWHIVPEEPDSGIMLMAVYIGELDDVTIVPDEDHVIVTINLYDQDGITIQNPIKVQQDKNDDGTASFEYELELPTGYTVESVSENAVYEEGKLTSEIPVDTEAWTIDVTCTVGTATYTIKIYEQNLEDDNYTLKSTSDDNIGTIGSLTEVVADPKTGFTAGIITQEEISADNSTVVEVYYNRNIYRLYYNTNKGSYIRSTTGKYGATISLADAAPTKTGYRFDGWYSDSTLSNKITEVTLQGDTTVYAKWVGDVVNYNIVYMIENADDDNYSYAGTAKGRAQAGTTVTLDKTQADRSAVSANVDLEHFTFKESTTVEIEPDGSSVITVKYSRKTYTITFHGEQAKILTCGEEAHEHSIWNGCYKWNGWRFVLDCDKRPHTHGNGCYSSGTTLYLTAKYQQDIGAKWLELVGPDTIYAGRSWRWDDSYYTSYQQIMPGENKHIYPNDSGDIVWNLYYYLEDPDGDVSYKGKKFTQEIAIVLNVSSGTTLTFDEEFCPIDGYDRYGSNVKGWENGQEGNTANAYYPSSDGAAKFYYTLSRYDLELVDGASTQSIPKYYKESISDVLEMEGILSVTEGTFDGWYFDPEFENPYSGDETMPKGGLVLYAKRVGVTHEVKFMDSMTDTVYDTQSVEDRDCVEIPDIPEKRGYVFDGWYTERACTNAFDYTTPITGDTTVYAKWIQSTTTTYTVYHQVADGTGFINIVEPEVISGMVGATVQARPLSASSMPEEYEGYVADKISDKCILKADPDENSIYFTYTKIDAYRYHVEYTYNGQVIDAFTEETQTTPANQITVHATLTDAMKEAGYKLSDIPAERSKRVTLTSQEATVTFALDVAVYTISYDLDGGTLTTANPEKYTANGFSVEGAAQLPITLNNPTKENWVFDGWELGTGTSVKLGDTHDKLTTVLSVGTYGNLSFKATWKREQVDGKVIYYFDDTENSSLEENPKWNVGETVYGTPSTEATSYAAANKYVLDKIDPVSLTVAKGSTNVIKIYYAKDDNGNGVPDKYEATVSYKVEGGTFKEAEGTDKTTVTQTYNMKKWDEASKTWVDDPKKLENIPTPEAGTGYDPASGAWVGEEPTNDTTVEDGKEYTYKYGLKNLGLTIKYVDEDGEELKTATGQDLLYGGSYDLVADNTIENARVITVGTGSDEKQYVLDSIEGAVTGSNVTEAVTVTLVYSLDEDENRVPDKYQKTVVYEVVKGYFNNDKELIEVEQHYVMATRDEDTNVWTPKDIYLENIPNPTPKEGYGNGKWTPATPTDATRVDAADKYVHTYTAQPRTLKVNYVDDQGNVLRNPYTADTFYNEPYDLADQILDNIEYEGQKYVYDGMSGDETSGTVKDSVEITVIYSLDANEDTVADKYQIEVVFAAVNGTFDENGTTQLEKIVTLKDPVTEEPSEDGTYTFPKDLVPTATPATGYVQPGVWDKDPAVTAITKTENHTFTITFDDKDKYQVTVEYYFDDVKDEDMTKTSDASFETIYEVTPDKAIVHNDTAYALDRVENNGLLVSSDSTKNVVKVYYALDEKGGKPGTEEPDEPGKPDEIPDKYQLVFRYRTDGNGTVTGTTYETHTFTDDDGNYTEISATSPKVAVTVSGNTSRYVFDYWTDDDGNRYETDADLKAATFTEDMTFTAHFDYTGGGSSSGGGGGGGGGTSSGSDPNNGPGVVNIEDGDVPLAPLPGDNGLYVIEDGDVPLAPLPKTGQKPMAATVGMLFSGILLALSTLRKRKEEN